MLASVDTDTAASTPVNALNMGVTQTESWPDKQLSLMEYDIVRGVAADGPLPPPSADTRADGGRPTDGDNNKVNNNKVNKRGKRKHPIRVEKPKKPIQNHEPLLLVEI